VPFHGLPNPLVAESRPPGGSAPDASTWGDPSIVPLPGYEGFPFESVANTSGGRGDLGLHLAERGQSNNPSEIARVKKLQREQVERDRVEYEQRRHEPSSLSPAASRNLSLLSRSLRNAAVEVFFAKKDADAQPHTKDEPPGGAGLTASPREEDQVEEATTQATPKPKSKGRAKEQASSKRKHGDRLQQSGEAHPVKAPKLMTELTIESRDTEHASESVAVLASIDPPWRVAFVGPSGCGKTTAAMKWILGVLPQFSRAFLFSATVEVDKTYTDLCEALLKLRPDQDIHPLHKNLEQLEAVMSLAEADVKRENSSATLVVIDDLMREYKACKGLSDLFVRGRHSKISVLIMSQEVVGLPPSVRKQLTHAAVWSLPMKEQRTMKSEWKMGKDDALEAAYKLATDDRRGKGAFLWMQIIPRAYYAGFSVEKLPM
jgi:hypothetical protein